MVDPGSDWINRLITQPLGLPPAGVGVDGGTMMALWSIGPGFLIMYGAIHLFLLPQSHEVTERKWVKSFVSQCLRGKIA